MQHEITVGENRSERTLAVLKRDGRPPGLFWLGGFRSDMRGSKAEALDALGAALGLAVTRFDYSGHGASAGDVREGTISHWLEEALAVFATTRDKQIVVGSSMGGWLALLLNRALRAKSITRVAGMVLVAPAVDMTEDLMRAKFSPEEQASFDERGYVEQPSIYASEPYVLTRDLIEDGARHLLFSAPISTGCPVHILQGGRDPDVPQAHAFKLVSHLVSDPVTLSLIPDGDHRLSRPQDLDRLKAAVETMVRELGRSQAA